MPNIYIQVQDWRGQSIDVNSSDNDKEELTDYRFKVIFIIDRCVFTQRRVHAD